MQCAGSARFVARATLAAALPVERCTWCSALVERGGFDEMQRAIEFDRTASGREYLAGRIINS